MSNTCKYLTMNDIAPSIDEWQPRRVDYSIKDKIKNIVPTEFRVWSNDDKLWYFHNTYIELVDKYIHRYTAVDSLTGLDWNAAWMTLYLRPGAPEVVINAACDALLGAADDPGKRTRLETARKICLEW